MGFADKVNTKSFDGDCINCTSRHRNQGKSNIDNAEDEYLDEKQILSSNLDAVYILAKKGRKSELIQVLKPYGNRWLLEGSITLSKAKITSEYFVFGSRQDAEVRRSQIRDRIKSDNEALEQFYELKTDLQTAAQERHLEVLKRFMKETAFIDRKIVNQALFAVTLNKRFKKLFYKLENDNHFLDHATADVMEEVLDLLNGLR